MARLTPFDSQQTEEMLKFRWHVAGGKKFPFSPEAVEMIYRISKGVPRSIVKLANETLIKTAVDNSQIADRDAVVAASAELDFEGV